MKLTTEEVLDAILAKAEAKAADAAGSADAHSLEGAADGMAAQVEAPTASVEQIRSLRAQNRAAFAADPVGMGLKFADVVGGLLKRIGLA